MNKENEIICLTEIWLTEKEEEKAIKRLNGYSTFTMPATREEKKGRAKGLLIGVQKKLKVASIIHKFREVLTVNKMV